MASNDYDYDLSKKLRKLRRNKSSNVCYSVRKHREQNPRPLRDRGYYLSRRIGRF